jgi:hypothetical protein
MPRILLSCSTPCFFEFEFEFEGLNMPQCSLVCLVFQPTRLLMMGGHVYAIATSVPPRCKTAFNTGKLAGDMPNLVSG